MPRTAFRKKVDETYKHLLADCSGHNRLSVTSNVIDTVSEFFDVSRQSAAIRMLELGYHEAEEFCGSNTVSKEKPSQTNKKGSMAKCHLKPITPVRAFELYFSNDLLKASLDTGAFYFAEGYFVLNDNKYLKSDATGSKTLTEYAKNHLAECVLDFSTRLIPDGLMHGLPNIMYRSDSVFREESTFEANTQNTELFNKAKEFEKKLKRSQSTAITPALWMKQRMNEEHWYETTFETKTNLDKMNYSRVQGGTHKFTMRPLVAMGVGLSLDLSEMEEVLSLGGMTFIKGNREHEAYKYLFTAFYGKDINECNDFLTKVDVKPLGTIQRL